MSKLRPLLILGTRPEAIKLAPVIQELRRRSEAVEARVCLTGQHDELLRQAADYFGIDAEVNLDLMTADQGPAGLVARCVERLDELLARLEPDCVVVQGDTASSMAASLSAFYRRVPLVHVEAGLRTGNLQAPWPEEMHRRVTGIVAALHCAPTRRAADALLAEGVAGAVHVTGNTVVDALLRTVESQRADPSPWQQKHAVLGNRRMVLITGHRRESFGQPLRNVCRAIAILSARFPDCQFVYVVHLNPNVRRPVCRMLRGRENVRLVPPAAYPEFVWLMDRSTLIITDSGGVQEEAPSLRKPLLVTREVTERPEVVECGAARLVGTSVASIAEAAGRLLTDPAHYAACQAQRNPYGDGQAASRIVELMLRRAWEAEAAGRDK